MKELKIIRKKQLEYNSPRNIEKFNFQSTIFQGKKTPWLEWHNSASVKKLQFGSWNWKAFKKFVKKLIQSEKRNKVSEQPLQYWENDYPFCQIKKCQETFSTMRHTKNNLKPLIRSLKLVDISSLLREYCHTL